MNNTNALFSQVQSHLTFLKEQVREIVINLSN